jgi:hypothetical protein
MGYLADRGKTLHNGEFAEVLIEKKQWRKVDREKQWSKTPLKM